ncbi:M20/M25/M40 family metallo-hydrolase [Sorangium sp. So ce131]|uniref:M20/M25/M40 family metallo-hydrolase n=1 Tax=Sorangium sp. So ce131 TaxID=3133282 RepID=UPI003F5F885D
MAASPAPSPPRALARRRTSTLSVTSLALWAFCCCLAACSGGGAPHAAPGPAPAPAPPGEPPAAPAAIAEPPCPRATSLDGQAIRGEAVCLLRRYLRIDTTNPPGNEAAAARFLRSFLDQEGIESTTVESAPGRANLVARLPGDGSKKAIALAHHMDVVAATASDWQAPPFDGVLRDGAIWGRGALDNKGPGIIELLSFALLKRLAAPLARDVVLVAVADEEAGGAHGARYLVEKRLDLLRDVELVLNEGGAILELPDKKLLYTVEFAQKAPLWLRIVAEGPPGHGSSPKGDSSTRRLIRALARLERHEFPLTVVPEVQALFTARAAAMPEGRRAAFEDLERSLQQPAFREEFLSDPMNRVLVRNTISITMLSGSANENVVPSQASAVADLRLLPGQDPEAVIAEIKRVLNEPSVSVQPILSWRAHASPIDTALFRAIGDLAQRRDPGARVTPNIIGGFTDCNAFRSKGITCYGFMPIHLTRADTERVHGRDERISAEALERGATAMFELVRSVAGR